MAVRSPPARIARTLAAAMALAAGAAAGAAEPEGEAPSDPLFSGFVYAAHTERQIDLATNPDNSARVPRRVEELAAVVDFRRGDFWARGRLTATRRDVPLLQPDARVDDTRAELTQMSFKLPLGANWALTIGRLNLGFDDGQSYHPLDFFEDVVRGTDFEDRAGRYRGFPMLMLSRADAGSSWRFIYADDRDTDTTYVYGDPNPNFNRGGRQWVASWRGSFDQLTVTAVAQRALPGHAGAGFSASYVADAAWSFHGAAFVGRGNPLPLHRNVVLDRGSNLDGSDVYIDASPMRAWRADSRHLYERWLLGTTWTSEDGDTVVAELWRDGRGMTRDERATWADVLRFHDGIGNPVGRRVNVGYDLEALRVPSGLQLFLRYSTRLGEAGAVQLSNLLAEDGSGSAAVRWTLPFGTLGDASLELWKRYGSRTSMNGAVPDPLGAALSLRLFF